MQQEERQRIKKRMNEFTQQLNSINQIFQNVQNQHKQKVAEEKEKQKQLEIEKQNENEMKQLKERNSFSCNKLCVFFIIYYLIFFLICCIVLTFI